jgi:tetratricopeptide (TPR) repeat protein
MTRSVKTNAWRAACAALGFVLSACTTLPAPQSESATADNDAEAGAAYHGGVAPYPPAEDLPAVDLDSGLLFDLLVGEIAAQRGQLKIAADALARAAKASRDYRVAERATRIALQGGQYQSAIESAQLWSELQPEAGAPMEAVAVVMIEDGRLEEATEKLTDLIAKHQPEVGPMYRRVAELLVRQSNQQGALAVMDRLVELHPDNPDAHYSKAYLADRFKQPELMAEAIDKALSLKPAWEDAALAKMSNLVARKRSLSEVSEFTNEFLRQHPRANKLRLHYARYLVDQGATESALNQFETLIGKDPNNADAQFAAGLLSIQLEKLDNARRYLAANLKQRPDNDQARLYLGQIAMVQERYGDAEKWYREIDDENYILEAQLRLGAVIAKLSGPDTALEYLRGLHPRDEGEYVRLVLSQEQVLRESKDLPQAKTVLDGAIGRYPENGDLLYARGLIAAQLDLIEIHEQDMRKLLAKDPENAQALNALGYTLADSTDRYQEAHELIQQALAIRPEDPFILDSMGWVQYRLGNHDLAIEYLERALTKRQDAEIAAHLGEVLWVTGQKARAQEVWEQALQEHPDNDVLLDTVKKLRQ